MVVGVRVVDGVVVEAAPIVRKFVGQPLANLVRWLSRQKGFNQMKLGVKTPAGPSP